MDFHQSLFSLTDSLKQESIKINVKKAMSAKASVNKAPTEKQMNKSDGKIKGDGETTNRARKNRLVWLTDPNNLTDTSFLTFSSSTCQRLFLKHSILCNILSSLTHFLSGKSSPPHFPSIISCFFLRLSSIFTTKIIEPREVINRFSEGFKNKFRLLRESSLIR